MKKIILFISTFFIVAQAFAEPLNISFLKQDLRRYHDSGNYQRELTAVIREATLYMRKEVAANKDHKRLALVLDIDETSLSNYPFIVARDFGGSKEEIHKEVKEAKAPAITPTLALFREALRSGVYVFFVTGRPQSDRAVTKLNLTRAGYRNWTGLYLRPEQYPHKSIIPFKTYARKLITDKGYTVIASIGDQQSDLDGGYAEKTFKLPNPYYYLP